MKAHRILNYENAVLILMTLANGVLALDRSVLNFVSALVVEEFHLSKTELGLLSSALSLAIAGSGFLLAALADRTGKRKRIQLITLVLFSLFSASSGLATGFFFLLMTRLVMGIAEGPVLPIAQSVMGMVSSPARRGFNMGFMQNVGAYAIGLMLGPILFTQIAADHGWRVAFFVSAIPGLLVALGIALWVKPHKNTQGSPQAPAERARIAELFKSRNMILCMIISALFSAWLLVQGVFLQLFLTEVAHMPLKDTGFFISITGIGGLIGGILFPLISDHIGRKPTIILGSFVGALAPLSVLFLHGSIPFLAAGMFLGWFVGAAAGALYVAVIPTESVSPQLAATAVAVSLACGEIFGGVIAPALAGQAADSWGLGMPFWISAACALICGVLSIFLKETAPRKVGSMSAIPSVAPN